MMEGKRNLHKGIGFLSAFVLWTVLIQLIDVQAAGPKGTRIGFAAFNVWFHQLTGVHMTVYAITDWLGLVPIFICLSFGGLGLGALFSAQKKRTFPYATTGKYFSSLRSFICGL